MSNVWKEEKRQQVLALGRLGWSLRQIEEATGVRRETASGYLKAGRPESPGPWPASGSPGKTGHFAGDAHRLFAGYGGRQGHRRRGTRPRATAQSSAAGERVRALPRADRRRARPRAQRHGHLAGPGRRPRLPGGLYERVGYDSAIIRSSRLPSACRKILPRDPRGPTGTRTDRVRTVPQLHSAQARSSQRRPSWALRASTPHGS